MTSALMPTEVREQYAEGAAHLMLTRRVWRRGYRFGVRDLRRLDDRIEAHLDALAMCGESGEAALRELINQNEPGAVAALTALRLVRGDRSLPAWIAESCHDAAGVQREIDEAFSWIPYRYLSECLGALFRSGNAHLRRIAVAAATEHQVPSISAARCLNDGDPSLASEVLRHIGTLRIQERTTIVDPDVAQASRYWMAWAGLLSGSRTASLQALTALAQEPGPWQVDARNTSLLALPVTEAHELLRTSTGRDERERIMGSALVGDPRYIPWLIEKMRVPVLARVAGEAFCTITGVDLVHQQLDGEPLVDDAAEGDRADGTSAANPDEELLWPDADKVNSWWDAHRASYQHGVRFLCGEPVTAASARRILKSGYQRHRALARMHLALLDAAVPVFGIDAPAWRQQAWLETADLMGTVRHG